MTANEAELAKAREVLGIGPNEDETVLRNRISSTIDGNTP